MQSQESDGIAAYLAHEAGMGADSEHVAGTIATTCRAIDEALAPIIGRRGVAALYRRSVHLASQTYPWLAAAQAEVPTAMDVAPLTTALTGQNSKDASAAGALLLQTFYGLLTTLVGPSLTERLLRSVWANFLSGSAAQDTTP
jgi:hypothetical protein